eukprot:943989-Pleurochrysis_carterae.AAC.1
MGFGECLVDDHANGVTQYLVTGFPDRAVRKPVFQFYRSLPIRPPCSISLRFYHPLSRVAFSQGRGVCAWAVACRPPSAVALALLSRSGDMVALQEQLRRAAIRNQALHTDWELGPMQNALEGCAPGLVILPQPTPRETFVPLLQDLRVQKLLKGESDYEVLDQHGIPIDKEMYDRWAIPVNDPALKDRLEANELLVDLFDQTLTLPERRCARIAPQLPVPYFSQYSEPGVARAWFYKLKVGSHGPLVMKPTEHNLLQGRNHLPFIGDVGEGNVQCEV